MTDLRRAVHSAAGRRLKDCAVQQTMKVYDNMWIVRRRECCRHLFIITNKGTAAIMRRLALLAVFQFQLTHSCVAAVIT